MQNIGGDRKESGESGIEEMSPFLSKSAYSNLGKTIDNSIDFFILLDQELQVVYRSQLQEHITGLDKIGCGEYILADLVNPGDQKLVESVLREALKYPGISKTCNFRSRLQKSHYFKIDCVCIKFSEHEDFSILVCCFKDISERKEAEDRASLSSKLLRSIGQSVIATDASGIISFWNLAAEKIYGWTAEDAVGKHVIDLIPTQQTKAQSIEIVKKLSQGKIWTGERKMTRKNGDIFPAYITNAPIFGADQQLTGVIGISTDMSEQKIIEQQLMQSLKEVSDYKFALDEASLVSITDEKGIIQFANENFCKISRYTSDELIGQSYEILDAGFHSKSFWRNLWATIDKGLVWRGELKNKAKDGSIFWVYITIVPFVNEKKEPYQFLSIRTDITDLKKIEEDKAAASEQLRLLTIHLQKIRELERKRIGREIHDELGQQLTAINMNVAWIDKNSSSAEVLVKEKLKAIKQLLYNSNQSIRRILSELRPVILDNQSLMEAIHWVSEQFTNTTGIPVVFLNSETDFELSESVSNCIFRVCQEALTNITRYAEAKKVSIQLNIVEKKILLIIEDDGKGFDIAIIEFDKKSFGILGMKERVQAVHGEFSLVSKPGVGTKILIELPLVHLKN